MDNLNEYGYALMAMPTVKVDLTAMLKEYEAQFVADMKAKGIWEVGDE